MSYSAELSVEKINVKDANTLSIVLSENPNMEIWDVEWEIKVLNDVKLRWAFWDETTTDIELLLEDPLMPNTSYSLLTVLGADGSIDFTTPWDVEWFTVSNTMSVEDQDIDSIEVMDNRTIIITYRQDIIESSLEYKLLAESEIDSIKKIDFYEPEIEITVNPPLISGKNYILMIIEMQDAWWNFLEFDTGIYDFVTPEIEQQDITSNDQGNPFDDLLEIMESEEWNQSIGQDMQQIDQWDNWENMNIDQDDLQASNQGLANQNTDIGLETSLESAWVEPSLEKTSEMNLNEAASIVTQTPDTGAETWVLIISTLVINSFYYLSRRKRTLRTA